ncbi:hypothetical protein QHL1GM_16630 [Halomonas sp. QHL1]|nr:hypothetical protein QHL1GM_16630 [Halomonas sp. QHL1]
MSEWYDNQKKPSSTWRERLNASSEISGAKRDNLSANEQRKLAKLESMAEQLRRGKNVQNRQLQTWLSEDEFEQIEAEWQEQLELRKELKEIPDELRCYEEKLKQATFQFNRAEGYSNKGKHSIAKKFYDKSESLCEDALEILQEILHYDAHLRIWFDRDISFEAGSDLGADLVSLPRLVTSRSIEKKGSDCRLQTKLQVKLGVVGRAINTLKCSGNKDNAKEFDEVKSNELAAFLKIE